jgi:hypothetical protein
MYPDLPPDFSLKPADIFWDEAVSLRMSNNFNFFFQIYVIPFYLCNFLETSSFKTITEP